MPDSELVLAVPAARLPAAQDALVPFSPALYDLLRTAGSFLPREQAETDEAHRQVIAYALVLTPACKCPPRARARGSLR